MKLTQGKIADLLNEPGCEHNHKKEQGKNKACKQQAQPGAAQGGCAFDGASIALVPITDAAHLVHGPIACAGNSWGSRGSLSSGAMTYKMGFTTDISENDIIFGGEKKLYKAIAQVIKRYNPPAVFVYSTCVTALIGDDLDAVCEAATNKFETPIIPVNSPGFVGSKNLGNRLAGESLLDYVVGTAEPEYTTPYDINLIGEYNIAGELWGVLPIFEKVGIRVLSKITGDATFEEIRYAHRAKLNVMICSKALINMGRKMEERYGIPYIEESFYGIADMNRCLRNIAEKIGDDALKQRVEDVIAEETAKLDIALAPYRARLKGKRMVLYTGGVKSWSVVSAAQDLGMHVAATSTKKSTEEDKAKGIVPLFHGSQGCTAFAKVLLVRHFREAIPLATTAMTEVSTILGGEENIEQAILTLVEKAQPDLIGLLTTGLTETRGDDMDGILKSIRQRHPELDFLPIIFVSTPDYKGALQDGFAAAVESIVATDYGQPVGVIRESPLQQVTILAGSLLTPGDVAEIKEIVEAFGLKPLVIPDLSGSVDGHLDDDFNSKTPGGTCLEELQQLERSLFTIAIGESMRLGAETLQQRFGTKFEVLPRLAGLAATDKFLWLLAQIANYKSDPDWKFTPQIPQKYERQRRQLQDAILDTHFYLGGKKVSLALEPDLLYQTSWLLTEMGAEIQAAVTTTKSPLLKELPFDTVTIGDLEDLEDLTPGSDLIITNSQGKSLANRLHIPLYRMGYPIYDRLGNGSRCLIGYRGTMQFLFDLGNIFIEVGH